MNLDGFLLCVVTVHGTWVSGRKLEHGVSVELKEGDSFQLGVSSRIYHLHFVSKFDADALKVPFYFNFMLFFTYYYTVLAFDFFISFVFLLLFIYLIFISCKCSFFLFIVLVLCSEFY
jgi:hypothetical protein